MIDRFEITDTPKGAVPSGVDRETGARVLFPEPRWGDYFLDVTAMRAQARLVRELDDPRVARVLSVDPVVLEAAPAEHPLIAHREIIDAAIELVDVTSRLMHAGVGVSPSLAWIERDERGVARIRVPAPIGGFWLHELHPRRWHADGAVSGIGGWVRRMTKEAAGRARSAPRGLLACVRALPHDDTRALLAALAPYASDPDRALRRAADIVPLPARPRPLIDLEAGIEAGERAFAAIDQLPERLRRFVIWPLAAAHHHRGCLAWERGDRDAARREVARAIELDPYARYLTTAALFAERCGETALAAELHDRAVSVIQPVPEPGPHGIVVWTSDYEEPPWYAAPHEARTLHARGVFHAKHGRLAEALADLEASVARHSTEAAECALSFVRRALG